MGKYYAPYREYSIEGTADTSIERGSVMHFLNQIQKSTLGTVLTVERVSILTSTPEQSGSLRKDNAVDNRTVCYFKTRIKIYFLVPVRNVQLRLIRNLSNRTGQKSAKISREENPGIIYTSVAAKNRIYLSIRYGTRLTTRSLLLPISQLIFKNKQYQQKVFPSSIFVLYRYVYAYYVPTYSTYCCREQKIVNEQTNPS